MKKEVSMVEIRTEYKKKEGDFYDFFLDFTKAAIERARNEEFADKQQGWSEEQTRETVGYDFLDGMRFFYKTAMNVLLNDGHFNIEITHNVEVPYIYKNNEIDD